MYVASQEVGATSFGFLCLLSTAKYVNMSLKHIKLPPSLFTYPNVWICTQPSSALNAKIGQIYSLNKLQPVTCGIIF